MSRSLRRGAIAASVLAISIASLSACGAGQDAQTLGVKPDNAATSVGNIKIQNATVLAQPVAGAEGPAVVSATLFNDGQKDETLESVTLPGTNSAVKLTAAKGGPVTVPAGGSIILGGEGNASAVIENGREAGKAGDVQRVVFRFSETGDVRLDAFVTPAIGYYKDYGPTGAAQPPSESPSPTGSPTAGAHGGEGEHGEQQGGEHGSEQGGSDEHGGEGEATPSESTAPAEGGTGH
ncbi:DUF461 domain-containing protein [Streptomyces formicae]|uniref:DUF461 domain-containing protein n=1 Tax=Streptomyces formicae TaxID=1616117 RepID=A0ABY3WZH2_9ACTN|nr:DUF461 domain-containing protein [Streptomyces formicae]UNM15935.1 DUF461 domain-containing protein [Streptomyces formicae]